MVLGSGIWTQTSGHQLPMQARGLSCHEVAVPRPACCSEPATKACNLERTEPHTHSLCGAVGLGALARGPAQLPPSTSVERCHPALHLLSGSVPIWVTPSGLLAPSPAAGPLLTGWAPPGLLLGVRKLQKLSVLSQGDPSIPTHRQIPEQGYSITAVKSHVYSFFLVS